MNRWSSKFYVPDLIEPKEKKMSIDRCSICEALVDTDVYPEVYRADYNDNCICDDCYVEPDDLDVDASKADFANDARLLDDGDDS